MSNIFVIILQIIFGLLGLFCLTGYAYLIQFKKSILIYKIILIVLNLAAIVLEVLFIKNAKMCPVIFGASIILLGLSIVLIEIFSKRKYLKTLHDRIIHVLKYSPYLIENNEIRNVLFEKYNVMYSISDIRKELRKIEQKQRYRGNV